MNFLFAYPHEPDSLDTSCFLPLTTQPEQTWAPPSGSSLFHRDEAGKVEFTEQEAKAASDLIAALELDERVKASKFFVCLRETDTQ